MPKPKITFNKKFIRESSHEEFSYLLDYIPQIAGNYNQPGISDYPLYAYFSTLKNKTTILEIGTYQGGSACMLSHNETNKVITYDIQNFLPSEIDRKNIEFRIGNFMEEDIDYSKITLMTIDVDPHDGNQERTMLAFLEEKWKGGLLILDDIHNGSGMEDFWNNIDRERHEVIDISDIGHGPYGTGLVNFNRKFDLTIVE